jgi:hypothetical protein
MRTILHIFFFVAILFLIMCGEARTEQVTPSLTLLSSMNMPGISASDALNSARKIIKAPEWKLLSISNTGVAGGSVTSEQLRGPEEALMRADGKAGQWVVEFFLDSPKQITEGGVSGKSYPLRRVMVTAKKISELAKTDIAVPKKLCELEERFVSSIDKARALAIKNAKKEFDVVSVASRVDSSGGCFWVFRFYNLKTGNVVANITVSGDGARVTNK